MAGAKIIYLFNPMVDKSPDKPNRVRELRLAAGMTLETLSAEVGISTQMLGFIERGLRDMKYSRQVAIAEALGVAPADLLKPSDHSVSLTQDELSLLEDYRQLDAQNRRAVRGVAESFLRFRSEDDAADAAEATTPARKRA